MTQDLKKEFFAYRNGIIAEQLRAAGDPHTMIMGCQLADIITIASHYNKDAQLAQSLWYDEQHRECRLAATMLYPIEDFSCETAMSWCNNVESVEVADVLCHRLLRHLDYAPALFDQLRESDTILVRYTAWRLLLNLLIMNKIEKTNELRAMVEKELETAQPPLRQVLESIAEELN